MNSRPSVLSLGLLLGAASFANATVIGFGQVGGSNATVPASLGSNATANGNGFVVSNGATPDIGLVWDSGWDIHTSNFFGPLESLTIGGGDWDNEGGIPRIGQMDFGTHTIGFSAATGFALVLNSFDFAHTAETGGTIVWDLTLSDSLANVVWQQEVTFVNGEAITVSPNFTGELGESYTLAFNRTAETYVSNGRHGIDNLSFNQVPEPGASVLLGFAGMALLIRRRN